MTATQFEQNRLLALGFTEIEPGAFRKTVTKPRDVALHGKTESSFTVTILFRDNGSYFVDYAHDGCTRKQKIYSYGWAKTLNAMCDTAKHRGFNLREEIQQ